MKIRPITGLCLGICAVSWNLIAEPTGNPYHTIATRNLFALCPMPIEMRPPVPTPEPMQSLEIKLTGITTLLGEPCAILEFFDPQTKRTDRPSYFRERDRYNGRIMIVAIDAELGLVRIREDGRETTLDFVRNGITEREVAHMSVPPSAPALSAMTREEAVATLEGHRTIYRQQKHLVLNILPPPAISLPTVANETGRH
jgi:hypothetical protein